MDDFNKSKAEVRACSRNCRNPAVAGLVSRQWEEPVERRLAAILAADVVGYTRLIRADEEGTLTSLSAVLNDLIAPKVTAQLIDGTSGGHLWLRGLCVVRSAPPPLTRSGMRPNSV